MFHVFVKKNKNFFELILYTISILFFLFIFTVLFSLFISTSFIEFLNQLNSPLVIYSIFISLETSLIVVIITLIIGLPVSYILALSNLKFKKLLDTLLDLPIIIPPLVSGLALLVLLSANGLLGKLLYDWNIKIIFTKKGIIIAQLFVASPFFIKMVKEGISKIPKDILDASSTLGASPSYTFFYIIIPMARKELISGIIMTWARALGEFGATAMVAGCIPQKTSTMTITIYTQAMSGDLSSSIALALILITLSSLIILIIKSKFS